MVLKEYFLFTKQHWKNNCVGLDTQSEHIVEDLSNTDLLVH